MANNYIDSLLIKSTAKYIEILAAYIINCSYLFSSNLIVGDDPNQKLPDIFTDDHTLGIEVTECEYSHDFMKRRIYEQISRNGGDYNETLTYIKKHFPKERFTLNFIPELSSSLGKEIFYVSSDGYAHNVDWMKEEYSKVCANKSKKLNKGNYCGITKCISLCVVMLERKKDIYDAELVLWSYLNSIKPNQRKFDKIFIINSDSLIIYTPSNIDKVDAIRVQNNIIVDFQITGTDYVKEISYDYNEIISRLKKSDVYMSACNKV